MELIGEGGFANVYRATYRGVDLAVKKWKIERMPQDKQELFNREVTINQTCDHPNVVHFLSASRSDPLCIVTEFVPGCNMYDLIHSESPYTWSLVCQMAQHAAAGVAHLHSRHIVHRDLKSLNLLVTPEFRVKVCDFGLSRFQPQASLKMTGGRGTVHWMAPEVIQHVSYGAKADVYSMGIILWELCARLVPYEGEFPDDYRIAEAVLLKQHRPQIPPYVPHRLAKLMQQCWQHDVHKRPTMTQLMLLLSEPGFVPAAVACQQVPHTVYSSSTSTTPATK
eukprot:TRINITY_DN1393_c0_g1_i1.p1 TRINITY_DN1393_c0_g1~~TRINITY_DN1393_c0_g1_i1.p1  ORF type:complete len:280 (-),score=58.09 TRINITY_DN1393_c0_g1_i1:34-873(-)